MSHGLDSKLLALQAQAMGLPILQQKVTWETYEAGFKDALEKLRICSIEIQTNTGFGSYEDQYQALMRALDPNSSTERKFLDFLYQNGLRLPDSAQKRVEGLYVQPDFYYEPRIWVFCDGTPHDEHTVQSDDVLKRQAIIAKGDEVWVYYYKDNLSEKVAVRPDIFRKVR